MLFLFHDASLLKGHACPHPFFLGANPFLRLVALDKLDTLGNVLLEVRQASLHKLLLLTRKLTDGVDLVHTVRSKLDVAGKVLDPLVLVQRRLDKRRLNDTLFAVHGADERVGEEGTGVTHRQGSRTGTGLGLHDLITTELNTLDERLVSLARNALGDLGLRKDRDDRDTRVTTDDGDLGVLGVGTLNLGQETAGTNDVEGGDTKEPLLVKDTSLLEDLGKDRDGRVDRVRDDGDHGLRAVLGTGLSEVTDDRGVGVEQVVTGHTGLAWDTSWDDDDLGALQSRCEAAKAQGENGSDHRVCRKTLSRKLWKTHSSLS